MDCGKGTRAGSPLPGCKDGRRISCPFHEAVRGKKGVMMVPAQGAFITDSWVLAVPRKSASLASMHVP